MTDQTEPQPAPTDTAWLQAEDQQGPLLVKGDNPWVGVVALALVCATAIVLALILAG